MHPLLFDTIPLYFLAWVCAAATGIALGARTAGRAGFPVGRSAIAIALLAISIIAGSKLLYLAEVRWFPFDDYVPYELRSSLHGFRIPGGILLFAAAMPLVCRTLGLRPARFGDLFVPFVAVALVLIRIGCFLNGCCFGKVSGVPWAVSFPNGSWVSGYHKVRGWIPLDATMSLPVHPLQLYFVLAAGVTFVALLALRGGSYVGHVQIVFYALFFGSTALLEPLRQNYLTLNNWLAPIATAVAAGVLVGRRSACALTPGNLPNVGPSRREIGTRQGMPLASSPPPLPATDEHQRAEKTGSNR
jgi:phosphatidylglycerol:prolipoprotein diacylglycerol transferase